MKPSISIVHVLDKAWKEPFKLRSNFARTYADVVAMAASDGFITTKIAEGFYGTRWIITPAGLSHLYALAGEHHK